MEFLRHIKYCFLLAMCALLLSSCEHDGPVNPVKPLEQRTVLLLKGNGEIYNYDGELVKTLPDCVAVTQIIVDGDDYFVSGVSTKDRVGYWKTASGTHFMLISSTMLTIGLSE